MKGSEGDERGIKVVTSTAPGLLARAGFLALDRHGGSCSREQKACDGHVHLLLKKTELLMPGAALRPWNRRISR